MLENKTHQVNVIWLHFIYKLKLRIEIKIWIMNICFFVVVSVIVF